MDLIKLFVSFILHSLIAFVLGSYFYGLFGVNTDWSWFPVWMGTINIVTFLMYGLDKLLAVIHFNFIRVPGIILHLLALAGGFLGGWAGMFIFNHKSNWKENPAFPINLTISTALYTLVFLLWFFIF